MGIDDQIAAAEKAEQDAVAKKDYAAAAKAKAMVDALNVRTPPRTLPHCGASHMMLPTGGEGGEDGTIGSGAAGRWQ